MAFNFPVFGDVYGTNISPSLGIYLEFFCGCQKIIFAFYEGNLFVTRRQTSIVLNPPYVRRIAPTKHRRPRWGVCQAKQTDKKRRRETGFCSVGVAEGGVDGCSSIDTPVLPGLVISCLGMSDC